MLIIPKWLFCFPQIYFKNSLHSCILVFTSIKHMNFLKCPERCRVIVIWTAEILCHCGKNFVEKDISVRIALYLFGVQKCFLFILLAFQNLNFLTFKLFLLFVRLHNVLIPIYNTTHLLRSPPCYFQITQIRTIS